MARIELKEVSKDFGRGAVIDRLSISFDDGAFTVLLGPSGCGKTTLLRMIAGIGPADSGRVFKDGVDITDLPPGRRGVAMVFQNYAIYPTMNVRANIEFCLKNARVPKAERTARVEDAARIVGLSDCLARMPRELSGGQRQRVALARAIVKRPSVFLMDEPLSNLDAKLRASMRSELIMLHRSLGATFIYVTHDQSESMAMADRIVLMDRGKVVQTGSPQEVYRDPASVFAAEFIGSPSANIVPTPDGSIGFRPERAVLSMDDRSGAWKTTGTIETREDQGADINYRISTPDGRITARSSDFSWSVGDSVSVSVDERDLFVFDSDGRRVRSGGALP